MLFCLKTSATAASYLNVATPMTPPLFSPHATRVLISSTEHSPALIAIPPSQLYSDATIVLLHAGRYRPSGRSKTTVSYCASSFAAASTFLLKREAVA